MTCSKLAQLLHPAPYTATPTTTNNTITMSTPLPRMPNGPTSPPEQKNVDLEREASHSENRLTNTVTLSSEMFENLYLSPKNAYQKSDLSKKLAHPTPIAIMGFVVGLTPLSCEFSVSFPTAV